MTLNYIINNKKYKKMPIQKQNFFNDITFTKVIVIGFIIISIVGIYKTGFDNNINNCNTSNLKKADISQLEEITQKCSLNELKVIKKEILQEKEFLEQISKELEKIIKE